MDGELIDSLGERGRQGRAAGGPVRRRACRRLAQPPVGAPPLADGDAGTAVRSDESGVDRRSGHGRAHVRGELDPAGRPASYPLPARAQPWVRTRTEQVIELAARWPEPVAGLNGRSCAAGSPSVAAPAAGVAPAARALTGLRPSPTSTSLRWSAGSGLTEPSPEGPVMGRASAAVGCVRTRPTGATMTLPRTVADVLTDHVVFEVQCITGRTARLCAPAAAAGGLLGYIQRQLGCRSPPPPRWGRSTGVERGDAPLRHEQLVPWVDFARASARTT